MPSRRPSGSAPPRRLARSSGLIALRVAADDAASPPGEYHSAECRPGGAYDLHRSTPTGRRADAALCTTPDAGLEEGVRPPCSVTTPLQVSAASSLDLAGRREPLPRPARARDPERERRRDHLPLRRHAVRVTKSTVGTARRADPGELVRERMNTPDRASFAALRAKRRLKIEGLRHAGQQTATAVARPRLRRRCLDLTRTATRSGILQRNTSLERVAASWPQAAAMSRPRVSRTVEGMRARSSTCLNAAIAVARGAVVDPGRVVRDQVHLEDLRIEQRRQLSRAPASRSRPPASRTRRRPCAGGARSSGGTRRAPRAAGSGRSPASAPSAAADRRRGSRARAGSAPRPRRRSA